MSTNRKGAWTPKGKGPNGRNLCYCGCGREVPKGCRTTFSPKCYSDWCAKYDPATQRRLVYKRDKGICAACGADTEQRAKEASETKQLILWLARRRADELFACGELPMYSGSTPQQKAYAEARKADGERPHPYDAYRWAEHWTNEEMRERFGEVRAHDGHTWEADHILPVIEGGGECDLSNLRTLCLKCHRKETAALAKRRAEKRKTVKQLSLL